MKNLILIRHAKSSWESPLKDIDRPLVQRGINDANSVSVSCFSDLPATFVVWSSIAKRASDTALIFAQNIGISIESIIFKEELYTFDEKELEECIKSCAAIYENVILFGHNGAITNFVNKFGDCYIENVPTCGFVSLEFDIKSWQEIKKGKIKKILFPKN